MKDFRTNITKRIISQKNREGHVFEYVRYLLHYKDPATNNRVMRRFDTRKEAEIAQNELILNYESLSRQKNEPPTLGKAVEYWLKSRESMIQPNTLRCYRQVSRDFIIGPFVVGTVEQRQEYLKSGKIPKGTELIPMLDKDAIVDQITTAELRVWYQRIVKYSTPYVARVAKKHLSSIFRLIEEDFDLRLCRMPSRPGAAYRRQRRILLSEDQVKLIFEEAKKDKKWGVYYAFPFLTGAIHFELVEKDSI